MKTLNTFMYIYEALCAPFASSDVCITGRFCDLCAAKNGTYPVDELRLLVLTVITISWVLWHRSCMACKPFVLKAHCCR